MVRSGRHFHQWINKIISWMWAWCVLVEKHTFTWLCVSACRCVRGSAPRCTGAPLASSRAVPLPSLTEGWSTTEREEKRLAPTLKLATATFHYAQFPPRPPLPLHPPPCLLMAAAGWAFIWTRPTAQTPPPAACITMTTLRREVLMLLIT